MATDYVSFFIRISPELHGQLVKVASDHGQSLAELSRRALQAYIDNIAGADASDNDTRLATLGDVRRLIADALQNYTVNNSYSGGDTMQSDIKNNCRHPNHD